VIQVMVEVKHWRELGQGRQTQWSLRLTATHSFTSTYFGGATMVLKDPLTSAALTNGWQRYSGLLPDGEGGEPVSSAPGDGRGSK